MKLFSNLIIFVIFLSYAVINANKSKTQTTRFDRGYSKCKSNECSHRSNDDACIIKCISEFCYQQIYGNYLLEYGEVNYELKNKFEICLNLQKIKDF